jgi:hypothetical protein
MFNKIKEFFIGKPVETVAEAPYKVETKSWEDTSDIALAQRPIPVAIQASEAMVTSVAPVAEAKPAKKPAAKKAPAAKKPRAPKAAK